MHRHLTALFLLLCASSPVFSEEPQKDPWTQALQTYHLKQEQASKELITLREQLATERAPLLKASWALQEEILLLEQGLSQARSQQAELQTTKNRLLKEQETLTKQQAYLGTLTGESLKASVDNLALGADDGTTLKGRALLAQHETDAGQTAAARVPDSLAFLLEQVKTQLGSHTYSGEAVLSGDNLVLKGRFLETGPETFFRSDDGLVFGRIQHKGGSPLALVHPLQVWSKEGMEKLFLGQQGTLPVDASGGKALRLRETKGNLYSHISKGGYVAFVILGVGLIAIALVVQKILELLRNPVDTQDRVEQALHSIEAGGTRPSQHALSLLKGTTRELFQEGLAQLGKPRELLEEHLYGCLLRIRLRYEHRLTLLAVIATAAPLLGLLGTVMGMVKTFALITVFGTGNAGKLSSGISEVLVATELGLMVAIPTLIAHGFLAHRIHKNMAQLERYSLEFIRATAQVSAPEPCSNSQST